MNKKLFLIILLGIICLGVFFRFYAITDRGFFISDEPFFSLVAKTLATTPRVLIDGIINHRDDLGAYVKQQLWWGAQHTTARPGFIFPVAVLMMFLGTHDYVPLVFNALVGTATIFLIYLLGLSVFNSRVISLLAAFLLSISNYHIFYSRSGLAQITTGFFLVLATWFYLRAFTAKDDARKKLFVAGICLGYLLSTHQSAVPMVGFILLFDLIFIAGKFGERLSRLFSLSFGILLTIAGWEMILGTRKLIANLFQLSGNVHTYLEELNFLFWNNVRDQPSNPDKLFYFDLLNRFDGWLIIALLFIGVLVFFLKKDWRDKKITFLFILTWFILVFWPFVGLKATRTFAIFIPILVLFCAYSLVGLASCIKSNFYRISLIIFFSGLIFVSNLGTTFQVLHLKSGYKEVADYLRDKINLEIKMGGSSWLFYDFYLNQKFEVPGLVKNPKILVSDWTDKNSFLDYSKQGALIKIFPNPVGVFYPAVKEIYTYYGDPYFAENVINTPHIDEIGIFVVR